MASRKRSLFNDSDIHAHQKEWDEASCPICMDHPHNAVLLLCSSYERGCRSYICDTSYRHSNCLDRFKTVSADSSVSVSSLDMVSGSQDPSVNASDGNLGFRSAGIDNQNTSEHSNSISHVEPVGSVHSATREAHRYSGMHVGGLRTRSRESLLEHIDPQDTNDDNLFKLKSNLKCPLCRGNVLGWKVVEEARKFLNLKPRSCSRESCTFVGNYRELRQHARRVHPTARPADVDPSRQQAWRHLEHQREYDDIVSAIQSTMPGAIFFGDYVVENGDRLLGERNRRAGEFNTPLLSTFFLFHMIGSMEPLGEQRTGGSRPFSRHRRSTGTLSRRRYLWGENLLGLRYDDDDEDDINGAGEDDDIDSNVLSDVGEATPNTRRRHRMRRSRSDEAE